MSEQFDLKGFRENSLKMSQEQLAKLLDVRQDTISRWEKNPESMSLGDLKKLASKTGMSLDALTSYEKPVIEGMVLKDTWAGAEFVKNSVVDYIKTHADLGTGEENKKRIVGLKNVVDRSIAKPKIVFLGRSDSGKSTMINALIGQNKMPTDWTPTTSIVVYIKHISDRPDFIKDELWIFKKGKEGEGWDDSKLNDEKYCEKMRIASGSVDMLSSYGTRHGANYSEDEVGSAVLFIESDILINCDILDVPGFTGGVESDNKTAQNIQSKADVLVYLSQASGFLSAEDCIYLKEAINNLSVIETKNNGIEPLSNLFVVASQAHMINNGNPDTLMRIEEDGAERFYKTLTPKYWKTRRDLTGYNYTLDDIKNRFYAYTIDIPNVRARFEKNLKALLEGLPYIIKDRSIELIKEYCHKQELEIDKVIEQYEGMLKEKENYQDMLDNLKKNEFNRKIQTKEEEREIISFIKKSNKDSKKEFEEKYDNIIDVDHVISVINEKGYRSKKEDMQLLSAYINSELEDEYKDILQKKSNALTNKIDSFITAFENNCELEKYSAQDVSMSDFVAKRAFASGLTGAGVLGGLAFWASTMGNLGGYILVAKGVSLLSALGISVAGGTAGAISAISAIGGPITLGIGLALIAALGVFALFSGGWKKKVGKRLVEAYNSEKALTKYNEGIDKYWEDTQTAFEKASESMECEWQNYLNDLEEKLTNYDTEEIEKGIESAKSIKDFFIHIPL